MFDNNKQCIVMEGISWKGDFPFMFLIIRVQELIRYHI